MSKTVTVFLRVVLDASVGDATASEVAEDIRASIEEDLQTAYVGDATYDIRYASIIEVAPREKTWQPI